MNKKNLLKFLESQKFSKNILRAFEKVPREKFIPEEAREMAYENSALSIGYGQTISQPYVIALMLEMLDLKRGQKVLEAGAGCGYVLALLSEIVGKKGEVYGIEIIKDLADQARENTSTYQNINIYHKDASLGLKEEAPFDRIIMSAAVKEPSKNLLNQLEQNGLLIAPIITSESHALTIYKRKGNDFQITEKIPGFIFVGFV